MNKTVTALASAAFAMSLSAGMVAAQAAPARSAASGHPGSSAACTPRTVDTRTNLVLDKHVVHRGDANAPTERT